MEAKSTSCTTSEVKPIETDTFNVEVLKLVKDAQQKFGLRHGDYQRYRQYCARRISRIRKCLNFRQGDHHKVQPKKISEDRVTDVRYLHLPIFDAERCWAYAMQLKDQANTEPRKQHHKMKKLKKAVQHAELLLQLCDSQKCDAITKLEAQAYCAWMRGTLLFEQEKWHAAMEQFTSSKTIYEKMGSAFVDDMKETYLGRVEEISPNIRYCAYNIGDESAINDLMKMRMKGTAAGGSDVFTSSLDALIEKTRERQSSSLGEVTWRGRTFPVKNERVRVSLLTLQETEKQLDASSSTADKVSVYETLMKELIDAQQALREELKDDQVYKAMLRGQEFEGGRVPNHIFLHTYLAYLRQTKTIERNLLMIETLKENLPGQRQDERQKLTKPQDLVRLYDIIIQNYCELTSLPGLEDDEQLKDEVKAKTAGCKAFRCYYAAQTCVVAKQWSNAIALLKRTQDLAQQALTAYKPIKIKEKETQALDALIGDVEGERYSCYASHILEKEDPTAQAPTLTAAEKKKPTSERLDVYYEDPTLASKKANLVQFPPDFQPIACKPLFFDVAGSMLQLPDLSDKIEQKKDAQARGGGLSGMMKGWLWGSKK